MLIIMDQNGEGFRLVGLKRATVWNCLCFGLLVLYLPCRAVLQSSVLFYYVLCYMFCVSLFLVPDVSHSTLPYAVLYCTPHFTVLF